jgi:PAS domain-containing protein
MRKKASYQELKQRVKALEKQILEIKSVEEALRGTEQKYRDLFENAPIAFFSIRADDGSILSVNSEAMRLLCYNKETKTRMNVLDPYSDTRVRCWRVSSGVINVKIRPATVSEPRSAGCGRCWSRGVSPREPIW